VLPPPLRLTPSLPAELSLRLAWLKGTESQTTWHRDRDVSVARPASGALSPSEHDAGWLDPGGFSGELAARREYKTWTERRSSSSATRTAREHHHETARSPARTSEAAHPACAGLGEILLTRLRPRPPRRTPTPGDIPAPPSLRTLRLARDCAARRQPRFHEPGTGRLSPPDTSRRLLESSRRSFAPTRSTRTPLVTRPPRRRKENPAPNAAQQSRAAHVLRSRLTGRTSRANTRM